MPVEILDHMVDTDVSTKRRGEFIDMIAEYYGADYVAQNATFGTLASKEVLRAVGKVLEIDKTIIEEAKKNVSESEGTKSIARLNPQFYEANRTYIDMCVKLEKLPRSEGCHAGAVCISGNRRPMVEYAPVRLNNDNKITTQFEMHDAQAVSLVKFDMLGLNTLDIIAEAAELAGFDYYSFNPPLDDAETFEMVSNGDTATVFQAESGFMTNVFKQIRPQTIEEFSACIAIGRPDTIQYLEPYKNRKFGLEPITYIHPELEPILGSTYGCIIYQEQILSIVKHFGGFSDGEADVFRKAIGKKIPELVKAQSEKFRTRALEKGYDSDTVQALYDLLVENGSYSFNHGHSIAYALNGYKTAYLKCHYYTLWMAAVLNNTNDDYEKISSTIKFCKDVGIKVTLPDINKSGFDFTPIKETRTILYGLDMIKGVQKDAIEMIMKNRPFSSFDDFMLRCGLVIDKTSTISLIKSGSLDSLSNKSRSVMLLYYFEKRFADGREDIKPIKNVNKNHVKFMVDNGLVDINRVYEKQEYVDILNEYRREMGWMNFTQTYMQGSELDWEMQTVNSFMSGDPFENVWLPDWDTVDIESIGWVGGVITNVTKTKIKKGKNAGAAMAFVNINTRYGVMDCVVFSEKWLKYQDILKFGATVVVCGQKDGDLNMRLTDAITLEKYKATVLTRLNK